MLIGALLWMQALVAGLSQLDVRTQRRKRQGLFNLMFID